MTLKAYRLTLTLKAPFFFPGLNVGAFGYDQIGLRDEKGRPVIPREQVRGLVRHGLEDLLEAKNDTAGKLLAAFGGEGFDALSDPSSSAVAPQSATNRGRIFFSDLVSPMATGEPEKTPLEPIPRVSVDPETGAAKDGHLMMIEQMARPGQTQEFTGLVHLYQDNEDPDFSHLLSLALSIHGFVGAEKSVGFGEIEKVEVDLEQLATAKAKDASCDGDRVTWKFTLDRPYLVDAQRVSENAYIGQKRIPGGALKGLLAQHLSRTTVGDSTVRTEAITDLRIGFATCDAFGEVRPASLVWDEDRDQLCDLAFSKEPPSKLVPQRDWKSTSAAESAAKQLWREGVDFGVPEERVHVAIDRQQGAVIDKKLFTTTARPVPVGGFKATLDFRGVDGTDKAKILNALSSPLAGLGRTDAILSTLDFEKAEEIETPKESLLALKLVTPGLLADYSDVPEESKGKATGVAEAYRAFWKRALPNSELVSHYATQRMAGGFQGFQLNKGKTYRPFLLTRPGSVFVFRVAADDHNLLKVLLRNGICRNSLDETQLDWKNCPFVSTNGFGELSIHRRSQGEIA